MKRIVALSICCVLFCLSAPELRAQESADKNDGADTLVLCPKVYQPALKPWVEYRETQGHNILVMSPKASAKAIDDQIAEVASQQENQSLKNVFIVGDVNDRLGSENESVKTGFVRAKVNVRFGSDPTIPTDNAYADLNGDGLPDLTIGRLPVDDVYEIKQFTDRVIEYESCKCNDEWQRRINCVAGVGGFGQMIDGIIEQTTKQMLTDLVPPGYDATMTYGSWTSPYCPDPRNFAAEAIARFNEGCMFWVYIGHGSKHKLDRIYMPDQSHEILSNRTVSNLRCESGSPIAIFLACYTGDFHDPSDCLAETMLRQPKGPIAVVCGTRVTMPYAMGLLSLEMVHEFFDGESKTLGELVKVAKRRMVAGSDNHPEYRQMIEGMGQTFSPVANLLKQERLEHVHLMHLLGDPLLKLKRPVPIKMDVAKTSTAGQPLSVTCGVPFKGKLQVEVSYKRDRLRKRQPRRKEYDSSESSFEEYQRTYEESRNLVCVQQTINVSRGDVTVELDVPKDATGKCVVRAMLVSESGFALGSSPIQLKRPVVRSANQEPDNPLR